jgi:hypothetical protein
VTPFQNQSPTLTYDVFALKRPGLVRSLKPIMIGVPPPIPLHCTFRSLVNLIPSLFYRSFPFLAFYSSFPLVSIVPQ